MKYTLKLLKLVTALLLCVGHKVVYPQFLPSFDKDYFIHKSSSFSMVFSEDFLKDSKKGFISSYESLSYYSGVYDKYFSSLLKIRPVYIFSSSRTQVTNAIVFNSPFLRAVYFPTGDGRVAQKMGIVQWLNTSIAHEMAHVYQWGQTSRRTKFLKSLFKNLNVIFVPLPLFFDLPFLPLVFIPLPLFLNPNTVMSLFFLEGHAVLMESLFSPGGRLRSGFTRALVLSQIKNYFHTTDSFIGRELVNLGTHSFSRLEKYSHGAYFFSYLMERYNLDRIQSVFQKHARYFIAPLSFISVKKVFEESFETSFESLVHGYVQKYWYEAQAQKTATEPVLFTSKFCPPFRVQDGEVMFLTSDARSTPVLRTLNLVTDQWSEEQKNLKMGRVFKIKGRYYTSQEHAINPYESVWGLFSEGMHLLEKYKSQNVQDIQDSGLLSLDTTKITNNFPLLRDGKFYDTTHSPALFGPQGGVYYFKQQKDFRVLYKNKLPLFKFRGFYGKPVGVSYVQQEPVVYFTAAVRRGSSLFAYSKKTGIYRLSDSDVIVDAVKGMDGRFLVCEMAGKHYSYKYIQTKVIHQKPVSYTYSFDRDSHPFRQGLKDFVAKKQEGGESHMTYPPPRAGEDYFQNVPYKPYNHFKEMGFSGLSFSFLQDPSVHYQTALYVNFTDPMEYSQVEMSYGISAEYGVFSTTYQNNKSFLKWQTGYFYKQGMELLLGGERAYAYIHTASLKLTLPLLKKGYWFSSLDLTGTLSHRSFKKNIPSDYLYRFMPSFRFVYQRTYGENFKPYREFIMEGSFKHISRFSHTESNSEWYLFSRYTMNMGREFYLSPFVQYKSAAHPRSLFDFVIFQPVGFLSQTRWDFRLRDSAVMSASRLFKTGLRVQKSWDLDFYFSRYPVSLSRIAPVFKLQYLKWANKQAHPGYWEYSVGATLRFVAHHRTPVSVGLYYGWSKNTSSTKGKSFQKKHSAGEGGGGRPRRDFAFWGLSLHTHF